MAARLELQRWTAWLEGAVLAAGVLLLMLWGGESLRASYHGYLHVAVGQSVWRDGLLPENPYHAGEALRYYTLYPALGVLLGKLGIGALWGFGVLNAVAALLFAPSLDALGRAFGSSFSARRWTFLLAVLGFNGLGWIGYALADPVPVGIAPVFALRPLCFDGTFLAWDFRLQGFLTKFLNVSSFGLALAPSLWALAAVDRERPRAAAVAAAFALAINPLVGGVTGVLMVLWLFPVWRGGPGRERLRWIASGGAAMLLALPFLLPALRPEPAGESLLRELAVRGHRWANVVGPVLLLIVPGAWGVRSYDPRRRGRWIAVFVLVAAALLLADLPWGNEYKLARFGALFWAVAAGRCFSSIPRRMRWIPLAVVLLSLPTTFFVARAYLAWARNPEAPPRPILTVGGRLELHPEDRRPPLTPALLERIRSAPADAVLLVHPQHPGTRIGGGLVQGSALAPLIGRALVVDQPHVHNDGQPDLQERLDLALALWGMSDRLTLSRGDALRRLRAKLPGRAVLLLSFAVEREALTAVQEAGGSLLLEEGGFALWSLPPLDPAAGS